MRQPHFAEADDSSSDHDLEAGGLPSILAAGHENRRQAISERPLSLRCVAVFAVTTQEAGSENTFSNKYSWGISTLVSPACEAIPICTASIWKAQPLQPCGPPLQFIHRDTADVQKVPLSKPPWRTIRAEVAGHHVRLQAFVSVDFLLTSLLLLMCGVALKVRAVPACPNHCSTLAFRSQS